MRMKRTHKPLSLFGDPESDDDPTAPRGLGYAAIHLGDACDLDTRGGIEDADARLRAMVARELRRPEWRDVDPRVRRAYLDLYGRTEMPARKLGPFDRQAVALAMCGTGIDHDAAERAALEDT